jgi:hypothetical protein
MKMRWMLAAVMAVVVVAAGVSFWVFRPGSEDGGGFSACVKAGNPVAESYPRRCRDAKGRMFTEKVSGKTLESKRGVSVLISSPTAGSVVSNPLKITGKVPGSWAFEANFGVELLDANRRSVASSYASVEGNWMTKKDVVFTALVPFEPPRSRSGYVVLHKANPSDLEGKADSVEIPIRFK